MRFAKAANDIKELAPENTMIMLAELSMGKNHFCIHDKLVHENMFTSFIVFCVGGSKELAVLYESYSTAIFGGFSQNRSQITARGCCII